MIKDSVIVYASLAEKRHLILAETECRTKSFCDVIKVKEGERLISR